MSDIGLEGKVAIVTGAGGSIGSAIARNLASAGVHVLVNDLGGRVNGGGSSAGPAQKTADEIGAAGGSAVANTDDIADWAAAHHIIDHALDSFGRLDIVVNNAAIQTFDAFQETSAETFDAQIRVNLYGTFNVARAAAPIFEKQRSGAYVHMTSSTGLIGMAGISPYLTSKAGVAGLSRSIAIDMAKFRVRSNCVAPAAFSRMSPPRADPKKEAHYREIARPERVAPIVSFLGSDAAAEITGQIIGVRGNELYLYSQPRPIRTLHRSHGWSIETIAAQLAPAWRASLTPLEEVAQVFAWPAM